MLLKTGESTSFALGRSDYVTVTNVIIILDGAAITVLGTQQFGPYAGGALVRVIGAIGGGYCDVTDLSEPVADTTSVFTVSTAALLPALAFGKTFASDENGAGWIWTGAGYKKFSATSATGGLTRLLTLGGLPLTLNSQTLGLT